MFGDIKGAGHRGPQTPRGFSAARNGENKASTDSARLSDTKRTLQHLKTSLKVLSKLEAKSKQAKRTISSSSSGSSTTITPRKEPSQDSPASPTASELDALELYSYEHQSSSSSLITDDEEPRALSPNSQTKQDITALFSHWPKVQKTQPKAERNTQVTFRIQDPSHPERHDTFSITKNEVDHFSKSVARKKLGQSNFPVYEGTYNNQTVAIKQIKIPTMIGDPPVPNPEIKATLNEMTLGLSTDSPHVVSPLNVAIRLSEDGQEWTCYAIYPKANAIDNVQKSNISRLSKLKDAMKQFCDITQGLADFHDQTGYSHNDLNHTNYLQLPNGDYALIDVGNAQPKSDINNHRSTITMQPVGSPFFDETYAQKDQWSLGLMLFELVGGKPYQDYLEHQSDDFHGAQKQQQEWIALRHHFTGRETPTTQSQFESQINQQTQQRNTIIDDALNITTNEIGKDDEHAPPSVMLAIRTLIQRLLTVDPNQRLSLEQLLQNPAFITLKDFADSGNHAISPPTFR